MVAISTMGVGPVRCPGVGKRIWEVRGDVLSCVLTALVDDRSLRLLLWQMSGENLEGVRSECIVAEVVARCQKQSPVALATELLLHRMAHPVQQAVSEKSFAEVADDWGLRKQQMDGKEMATLLWVLACDRRREMAFMVERTFSLFLMSAVRSFGAPAALKLQSESSAWA